MNCGFCAEYCPFDAIKMDHDYEIASYGRNVYNMEQLLKPASYYAKIRPQHGPKTKPAASRKPPRPPRPKLRPLNFPRLPNSSRSTPQG